MDLLLRALRAAADQGAEFLDHELSAKEITIGSSQDQLIRLIGTDIGPRHAVLQLSRAGASQYGGGRQGDVPSVGLLSCRCRRYRIRAERRAEETSRSTLRRGGHDLLHDLVG